MFEISGPGNPIRMIRDDIRIGQPSTEKEMDSMKALGEGVLTSDTRAFTLKIREGALSKNASKGMRRVAMIGQQNSIGKKKCMVEKG